MSCYTQIILIGLLIVGSFTIILMYNGGIFITIVLVALFMGGILILMIYITLLRNEDFKLGLKLKDKVYMLVLAVIILYEEDFETSNLS